MVKGGGEFSRRMFRKKQGGGNALNKGPEFSRHELRALQEKALASAEKRAAINVELERIGLPKFSEIKGDRYNAVVYAARERAKSLENELQNRVRAGEITQQQLIMELNKEKTKLLLLIKNVILETIKNPEIQRQASMRMEEEFKKK